MKIFPLLAFLAGASLAQTQSYRLLPAGEVAPSARVDGTIAHDPATRQLYLFGGQDGAGSRNDLWVHSLDAGRWQAVTTASAAPPARFGHTLLWDARRHRLILFGGQSGGFFSDVWAFDVALGSWQQLARDDAGPSRRYGHSAIYEPGRDRMVISHGFTNSGRFDDTWAFDLAGNGWRNLTPSGTKPLRRCLHHAVYDAERNQMLLYGGCASGFGPCPLGDLWSFNLNTNQWIEQTGAVKPPPREHYGIGFDDGRGRLVIFGGEGAGTLNDTWEFDASAATWQVAALQGSAPEGRGRHESASYRDVAFFFGGRLQSGELTNELWMLGATSSTGPKLTEGGVTSAFSGRGGPVAPGQLVSIFGSGLGPVDGFVPRAEAGQLPTEGGGVRVTWNGIPSPLTFVRADQLNVQVPYELAGAAEARVVVTVDGQAANATVVPLRATRPDVFPSVWNQDGRVNSADNPAEAGGVIVLYATGQGLTIPASRTGSVPRDAYPEPAAAVSLTIGGQPAEILFRGQAPGTVGVMQINARVSRSADTGRQIVRLRVGDDECEVGVYLVGS